VVCSWSNLLYALSETVKQASSLVAELDGWCSVWYWIPDNKLIVPELAGYNNNRQLDKNALQICPAKASRPTN
jgi:hypothetical protein